MAVRVIFYTKAAHLEPICDQTEFVTPRGKICVVTRSIVNRRAIPSYVDVFDSREKARMFIEENIIGFCQEDWCNHLVVRRNHVDCISDDLNEAVRDL